MAQRLVDRYQPGDRVEVRFPPPIDDWLPGRVVRRDHPGLWVETDEGHQWFVTNSRRIWLTMPAHVRQKLLALNRNFYEQQADSFAASRDHYQDGYPRLLPYVPVPCAGLLDVGCGEGRFGRFLQAHQAVAHYVGLDGSAGLLAAAREKTPGTYHQRDISRPGFLAELGSFPAIACLSTLQHIPGRDGRRRLLQEMAAHLEPGGVLFLANWQFTKSPRQQRKILPWSTIGLTERDVEPGDYLLSWQRQGSGMRYVTEINLDETRELAHAAGFKEVAHFRSDGREGDLNLYTIWRRPGGNATMVSGG
jgi:SAM-dependent methyltransferase